MMLNDRKHPCTPSQNGVTKGECKLCILVRHHDNDWNHHLYPRHNDTYTMTKRPYKDVTTGYYIMALKKQGTHRHFSGNNCYLCSSVSLLLAWQWILPMSSWLQQMCFLNFASAIREEILCKDLGLVERFSNISDSELYWRIRIVLQNLTMCVWDDRMFRQHTTGWTGVNPKQ